MKIQRNRHVDFDHFSEVEYRHWLRQGADGVADLLANFCPYLFAIDSALCKRVTQLAFKLNSHEARPIAILAPPADFYGWQLAFIAKYFDVYLWTSELDHYIEEAAEVFNATIFSGDIPQHLVGAVDLFVYTDFNWNNEDAFFRALLEARNVLSEEGEANFILRCHGHVEQRSINWHDGSQITYESTLKAIRFFGASSPLAEQFVQLEQLRSSNNERVREFSKRHKKFFGKSAHDLCSMRILAEDFQSAIYSELATCEHVGLLTWGSSFITRE